MGSAVGQSAPDVRAALVFEALRYWLAPEAVVALDALVAENTRLREALEVIPAERLEALANWVDLIDHERGAMGAEVQADLRRMAALSRVALEMPA